MNKRMTSRDVVAELRDGMTIGVGGWGARRKPMALVREVARSALRLRRGRLDPKTGWLKASRWRLPGDLGK